MTMSRSMTSIGAAFGSRSRSSACRPSPFTDRTRLVPYALQERRQQLAVELGVIDDEDPAGPDRAITGGWGHAGPPAVAAEPARASAASSSSGRMGLLT